MMRKENPNSFIEESGIRCIEDKLERSKRIKCHFSRNDKTPLFDGYFNLLSEDKNILKQFEVQIKSTNNISPLKRGKNKGKYRYYFDKDVLESVRTKITENPTIYFVVNPETKKILYKYLDIDFLVSLDYIDSESSKITYCFSEDETLNDINSFIYRLEKIQKNSVSQVIFKSSEEIKTIQIAMNGFYKKLNDIDFISKSIWPNLWKFGIKTSESYNLQLIVGKNQKNIGGKCSAFAIYPIQYGSNTNIIQDYIPANDNMFNYFDMTNQLTPEKYLDTCLSKIISFYFNKTNGFISYLPSICLFELIFSFLDQLADLDNSLASKEYFHAYYKNELSYDELMILLTPYINVARLILTKEIPFNSYDIHIRFFVNAKSDKLVYFDEKKIYSAIRLFFVLEEIKKRKISSINRPWNYSVEMSKVSFPCYTADLFDYDRFCSTVDSVLSNISDYVEEIIDRVPIKIRKSFKGTYYYKITLTEGIIKRYTIRMALIDSSTSFKIVNHEIDNDALFICSYWSSEIEDLFEGNTPIYNCCRIVFHQMLCEKLNVDNEGVLIENRYIKKMFIL